MWKYARDNRGLIGWYQLSVGACVTALSFQHCQWDRVCGDPVIVGFAARPQRQSVARCSSAASKMLPTFARSINGPQFAVFAVRDDGRGGDGGFALGHDRGAGLGLQVLAAG